MTNVKSKRNSLIELYRFLFAMWVVYFHGYFFLVKSQYFSGGYVSVDFFFILTGFFVLSTIKKACELPFFKGLLQIIVKKLKPLGIALAVSIIFAQIYFWMNLNDLGDPLGFMWYIKWLVVVPCIYYVLYRFLPRKWFYITLIIVVAVSYSLLYTVCFGWGVFRGLYGVGMGILISQIPKINFKATKFNYNLIIVPILIIGTIVAACFKGFIPNADHLFLLFLFPALLYFTSCTTNSFVVFNYLGGLSFGYYAYQTILRLLEHYNIYNDRNNCLELFLILTAFVILDDIANMIVRYIIRKRKHNKLMNNLS